MLKWQSLSKSQKGLYLALATAVISGLAVFLNKFATQAVSNSNVFTTAKNLIVALILSLFILTPAIWKKLKNLKRHDWLKLILIGLIGGSIPFLLFFKGLSLSTSVNSAFIHKTLFIWVTMLAIPFLKEKLTKIQLAALAILIIGNTLLAGITTWKFNAADLLIFSATLMWAIEFIIAKKVLTAVDAKIVAWARMFFGAIFLLSFLLITNQASALVILNIYQWSWIGLTSVLLLGYVLTWYSSLQKLPASVVTSILVIASPITTALNAMFTIRTIQPKEVAASLIIVAAIVLFIYAGKNFAKNKQPEKQVI